jgi:hypothetical protein
MFQDPKTGRCSIPQGTTTAKGVVQRRGPARAQDEEITATFVKEYDQISDFRLGYDLEYFQEDTVFEWIVPSDDEKRHNEDCKRSPFEMYPRYGSKPRSFYRGCMDLWERNAGGMLQAYAPANLENLDDILEVVCDTEEAEQTFMDETVEQADYMINLYTVLSAHKPEERKAIKKKGNGISFASQQNSTAVDGNI